MHLDSGTTVPSENGTDHTHVFQLTIRKRLPDKVG